MKRHLLRIAQLIAVAVLCGCLYVYAAPYRTYTKDHCEWCGAKNVRVAVHHIQPQHLHPELANDHPENLVTLCDPLILRKSGCHWRVGHRSRSWSYDNSAIMMEVRKLIDKEIQE